MVMPVQKATREFATLPRVLTGISWLRAKRTMSATTRKRGAKPWLLMALNSAARRSCAWPRRGESAGKRRSRSACASALSAAVTITTPASSSSRFSLTAVPATATGAAWPRGNEATDVMGVDAAARRVVVRAT